jgi:hypothetical protein
LDSNELTQARLGLRRNYRLSSGVEPGLLQGQFATNQCIAAAEVMLKDGHKGTKQMSTIACRLDLRRLERLHWHQRKFLVQYIAPQTREGADS